MPTLNFPQLVEDTLVDAYVRVRGHAPEGVLFPNDRVQLALRQTFKTDIDALIGFLKMSMYAHMARTELTRTPFFINSHLLAESSLEFMDKHAEYLKSFYGSGHEPKAFEQSVFGAVLATEIDFLDTVGNYFLRHGKLPGFEILRPSVWWMIWCDTWNRLRMSSFPDSWMEQKILHRGHKTPARQLFAAERGKLSDRHRCSVAEVAAQGAIREAALNWAARHRAVRILYHDDGSTVADDSLIDGKLLDADCQLARRDLALFEAVRSCSQPKPIASTETKHRPIYNNPATLNRLTKEAAATDDV